MVSLINSSLLFRSVELQESICKGNFWIVKKSVFDHFVGLALKGLIKIQYSRKIWIILWSMISMMCHVSWPVRLEHWTHYFTVRYTLKYFEQCCFHLSASSFSYQFWRVSSHFMHFKYQFLYFLIVKFICFILIKRR